MTFDGKAFGKEIVGVVKEYVRDTIAPILVRLDAIEKRQPEKGERGPQGEPGEKGERGERGEKGDPGDRGPEGPPGKDGAPGAVGEKGDKGESGADGSSGERGPQGEAGQRGERGEKGEKGDPGDPGPAGDPGRDGANGKDGADGVGLAGAVIDRSGGLILTLTDGTTRELGLVVGRDGQKGDPGQDGKDGADGLGFDDLEVVHDGLRTFTFRFAKGEKVKEFPFTLPVVLDCGVFKAGETYAAGDGVTWGGSFWIAQKDTTDKPGEGDGWRLSVKKGRDGKDGIVKAEKPKQPLKVG